MRVIDDFVFISDMDGTLLPNQQIAAPAGCLDRTIDLLYALLDANCPVAYCTGRSLPLAQDAVDDYALPAPTYWICNVGTEIYESDGTPVQEWTDILGTPLDAGSIQSALSDWPELAIQSADRNGPFKVSFTFPRAASQQQIIEWQSAVAAQQAAFNLVSSHEESTGATLVDFLASNSGKANACHFIRDRYGLSAADIFFSGDSGNDIDALQAGFRATLVSNADPQVKVLIKRGGGRAFVANTPYGDGIIEGLRHFKLIE